MKRNQKTTIQDSFEDLVKDPDSYSIWKDEDFDDKQEIKNLLTTQTWRQDD